MFANAFEVFDVDVVRSCGVVVLAVFDGCLYLFRCDDYLCWLQPAHFPRGPSVCGAGLVRNSVDEPFAECTCDVPRVDVCVVFESY